MRQLQEFYHSLGPEEPVVLVAPEEHRARLQAELEAASWRVDEVFGRLLWARSPKVVPAQPLVWAIDCWRRPQRIRWKDDGELSDLVRSSLKLGSVQDSTKDPCRWLDCSTRRFENSQSVLKLLKSIPIASERMKWAQIRADEGVLAAQSLWPWGFLRGAPRLRPKAAPSDAISKLLEAFEMVGAPQKGDRVIDLGASPGSWTYAALSSGARVFACDRSPLASQSWPVALTQRLQFRSGNAFAWDFSEHKPDWILSDLICTPEKLWGSLEKWIQDHPTARFVCTLKFKGDEGLDWIPRFSQVPGAAVIHLQNNQNEVCFLKMPE